MNRFSAARLYDILIKFLQSDYEIIIDFRDKSILPFSVKIEDDHITIIRDDTILFTIAVAENTSEAGKITMNINDKKENFNDTLMREIRQIMLDERL